jgi:hypothetical protein
MRSETVAAGAAPPSKAALAKAMLLAVMAAAVILVGAVLPAEYGVDPIGTGRMLGLLAISSPAPAAPIASGNADANVPVQSGPVSNYGAPYRADAVEIEIGPYEFVEYKYRLEKGATMLYSWSATAPLTHDMHGERDGGRPDESESFEMQVRRRADGAFIAPFSGIHGWFWENPSGETVTVSLSSSGFYSAAVEIRSDRTRTPHPLTPLDAITFSQEGTEP